MQNLIIIRGNSGSGKSTVAKALRDAMRERFGKGSTMLVSQDVVRIEMLDVKDTEDNESIALIDTICRYGMSLGKNVILEGILDRRKYGKMLNSLMCGWQGRICVYYYDIPLEVTLQRHDTRPQRSRFSKEKMREWYQGDNCLGVLQEKIITEEFSVEDVVVMMLNDCSGKTGKSAEDIPQITFTKR